MAVYCPQSGFMRCSIGTAATDPEQTFIASDNIAAREGRLTVLKLLPRLDIWLGQAVGNIE